MKTPSVSVMTQIQRSQHRSVFSFKEEMLPQKYQYQFLLICFLRMLGSAQSARNITPLSRGTVFAAGLCVRTGTKTFLDLPIPFLFLTSQHVVPSLPTMRKMTVTQALISQTAAGQCLILSFCPPTPQLTDHCPL